MCVCERERERKRERVRERNKKKRKRGVFYTREIFVRVCVFLTEIH